MESIIRDLAAEGLDGLEACHREVIDAGETDHIKSLADELGLITTGGSDYHGDTERINDLGIFGTTEDKLHTLIERIRKKAEKARKN